MKNVINRNDRKEIRINHKGRHKNEKDNQNEDKRK